MKRRRVKCTAQGRAGLTVGSGTRNRSGYPNSRLYVASSKPTTSVAAHAQCRGAGVARRIRHQAGQLRVVGDVNVVKCRLHYSCLSACTGSKEEARKAGTMDAPSVTAAIVKTTPM